MINCKEKLFFGLALPEQIAKNSINAFGKEFMWTPYWIHGLYLSLARFFKKIRVPFKTIGNTYYINKFKKLHK